VQESLGVCLSDNCSWQRFFVINRDGDAMKNFKKSLLAALITGVLGVSAAHACTDFRLKAADGTVLVTRSLEFAETFNSNIRSSPRNRIFTNIAPDGKAGLTWKGKYGYVYLDGLNVDVVVDGMNEAGLSFEALYLPGLAEYQAVPVDQSAKALPYSSFGEWILSNFQTIDEVRQALPSVYVFANKLQGLGDVVFPLHFSIYDASGKGIVIEYIAGKLHVHDNIGVMTNSPSYDWHTTNLVNYIHLAPINPPNVVVNGITFEANGQGYGMIGLPGDISPPSRFVKTATLLQVVVPSTDATGALNMAQHIINNVDIPLGVAREPQTGNYISDITQWVVFKDLTHKNFYYRTYDDLTLRMVSLAKVNFTDNAPRLKMPIASKMMIEDLSDQFTKSVSMAVPENSPQATVNKGAE
jgi:choloylglycine hydrolase